MFSIYDYDGRLFRNTLEELYRVNPVSGASAADLPKTDVLTSSQSSEAKSYVPNNSSIQAYKELIHANPKDELHHAYEIMQEDFIAIKESQTIFDAIKQLRSSGSLALPVVNEVNRVVGLFDYNVVIDELVDGSGDGFNPKITTVKELLGTSVITAEPVTSIRRIAEVMDHYNLSVIPVVDAYDALIGIISIRDMARSIANDPPLSVWS